MCGAIRCAASISSTAPIAKLGATKQLALGGGRFGGLAGGVEIEAGGAGHDVDAGRQAGAGRWQAPYRGW